MTCREQRISPGPPSGAVLSWRTERLIAAGLPAQLARSAVITPTAATIVTRAVSVAAKDTMAISRARTSTLPAGVDDESRLWLQRLRSDGPERDQAQSDLRELLQRAARYEVHRRGGALPHLRGADHDDLAQHSADDALLARQAS